MLNGVRYIDARSLDGAGSDARQEFVSNLSPVSTAEVTIGHLGLQDRPVDDIADGFTYFTHKLMPEIIAAKVDERIIYLAPPIVGPARDDTQLDLTDPAHPLICLHGGWVPLPRHAWSGVQDGYSGTGPAALAEVIVAASLGRPSTGKLLNDSILEQEDFPTRPTMGQVLSGIQRA